MSFVQVPPDSTGKKISTVQVGDEEVQLVAIDGANSTVPDGAATETTLEAIQALTQELKDFNENMFTVLVAIFEKMPRVTNNDQAAVSVESGTVAVSSLPTLTNVTAVGTITTLTNVAQVGGQEAITAARAQIMAGTYHIYNNIVVS